ncbi:MAG: hypothetical protein FJZ96_07540 [Chloroflexi bacterium]|nr:hypothetical protein [Chloroflexota bacterium]
MNRINHIFRTYRQALWRTQRQWIGLFLISLVVVAMVAAVYLSVTARAGIAGRQILMLQEEIAAHERTNADLETELASLSSTAAMQERAAELGYRPAEPADLTYVVVPGYSVPTGLAIVVEGEERSGPLAVGSEYTESLFEWFNRSMNGPGLAGVER